MLVIDLQFFIYFFVPGTIHKRTVHRLSSICRGVQNHPNPNLNPIYPIIRIRIIRKFGYPNFRISEIRIIRIFGFGFG
ncbi:hypothetical protein HanPSC8_Chr16g0734431 [Helianthus annuus]|uniref:Uncharacterized protein n=1 Tax=Helianthus annuus TaxID=4232 RepID=A0A251S2D1_HELAN|nr:hypothetical protein HanPSC8_Chr16g0734431 [Helianthus annuus]